LKEGRYNAVYGPDGSIAAISLVIRDVQGRKLAQTRLNVLTKLSTLAGILEYDELAEALARVPIPELADWCVVNFIEGKRIRRSFVAHRDPAKAPLRDAIVRALPPWDRHPLWQELLTSGFQLLTEVNEDLVRRMSLNEQQYRLLSRLHIRSLMVVPLVSRGVITGVITFAYTDESGRRYGRDDPALAEELALHAAHTFENARLLKDLKATEARFHIALSTARTVVYEQDPTLRYIWSYNPMGLSCVGKSHEELFPPGEARMLTAAKQHVLEDGERIVEEMDFTCGTEGPLHYRETIEPRRDSAGRIIGVIGAATDITEQHRAKQQLTEELAFRERMMGILGHDLRNPLNAVMSAADLLLRREQVVPEGRERLLRLRHAAGRMQEMIDTLLDFTRARFTGRVPVSRVQIDLTDVARSVIDELRLTWPDRPIALDVRGDSCGEWDPARMSQTIANLVTNAITYGQGTVRIVIEGTEREVTINVHNRGSTIPPEVLPTLFEPFRRGVSNDQSPAGLGLGLYVVEQIVKAHDGAIVVESTKEAGTVFTVRLPRCAMPSPGPSA
jgi:signal transduction histidine kinase